MRKDNLNTPTLIVGVIIIFLVLLTLALTERVSARPGQLIEVTVSAGDTIDSIAGTYGDPHKDRRKTIYEISEMNNRPNAQIYVGETIKVVNYRR